MNEVEDDSSISDIELSDDSCSTISEEENWDGTKKRRAAGENKLAKQRNLKVSCPTDEKREMLTKFEKAAGKYKNINQAAKDYDIKYKTLWKGMVKRGGEFPGSGTFSSRLSPEEEKKVVNFAKMRASIGYGVDWEMLRLVLQEVLQAVKKSNPERITGLEECGQLPPKSWVRRFAERHNLVLRATMGISKGRQVVTAEELGLWQGDAIEFFSAQPDLLTALQVRENICLSIYLIV